MPYELIITEKPSVAKKLAEALADSKAIQKRDGQVSYYLISHKKKDIVVTCAVGHLFTVTENSGGKWEYPVFDVKWEQSGKINKASEFTKKYAKVIKDLSKDANEFTVATDYDIEGEVIGFNVVKYLCKQKDANRMKFSALTKGDLVKSYENKAPTLNWGQANAGVTRHELDWFYGINLSRALSAAIKKAGQFKILSSGRVQGPALKILCDKERDIQKFIPKPYFDITLKTEKDSEELLAEYEKNPVENEKTAKDIVAKTNKKAVTVSDVDTKQFQQAPPNPFDLTSAQVEAYRLFGIQPKETLSLLQDLYIGGWTSYPRTSSQKLPKELGYEKILKDLSRNAKYKKNADFLLAKKSLKPNEGKKEDDAHPAIYPTGLAPQDLDARQTKIYDLIVKRFMATFGDPATRETIKASLDVEKEIFIVKGTRTIEKGWHALYEPYVKLDEVTLPKLSKGESVINNGVSLERKETKPPKRYTPASIIKELEKRGLGTKATRAQIVDNLYDRGYLDAKSIQVTEIGLKTCDVLEKYCPEILDEAMTRQIEDDMEEIRLNKKEPEAVKNEAKEFLTKSLADFKQKETDIGKGLLNATRIADIFGSCPTCKEGNMILRKGKYGRFLACDRYPDCSSTLKLPLKGKIRKVADDEQEEGHFYIEVQLPKKGPQKVDLLIKEDDQREPVEGEGSTCEKCGEGTMVYRKGFYGAFLGCNNYPKCKNIINIPKEKKNDDSA
ncbi:MAG: DNA topoisomerase I [Candidatus Woesearchaeota archaeon]